MAGSEIKNDFKNNWVFILGKNRELSSAEVSSYFQARGIEFKAEPLSGEALLVELFKETDMQRVMDDLGGAIKICRLLGIFHENDIRLDPGQAFPQAGDKVRIGISIYSGRPTYVWDIISSEIDRVFEGSKVQYVKPSEGDILKHYEVLKKLLRRDGYEITAVVRDDGMVYVSRTVAVHDPYEFKKRDMGRPCQRTMYSIPPRLAKVLINLSMARPGDVLLDPFCGIGTILQEALLMGMDFRGVDIDHVCIKDARVNLQWIMREHRINKDLNPRLRVGDATHLTASFRPSSIDAIATEPYLGPALKEKPSRKQAEAILNRVRALYLASLKEMAKVLKAGGCISMVCPSFEADGQKIGLDVQALARGAGLSVRRPLEGIPAMAGKELSIVDADLRHNTRREIVVFKKG